MHVFAAGHDRVVGMCRNSLEPRTEFVVGAVMASTLARIPGFAKNLAAKAAVKIRDFGVVVVLGILAGDAIECVRGGTQPQDRAAAGRGRLQSVPSMFHLD